MPSCAPDAVTTNDLSQSGHTHLLTPSLVGEA